MNIKTEKISENQIVITITNPTQKVIDFINKMQEHKKEMREKLFGKIE